jgi:hypothetical protein
MSAREHDAIESLRHAADRLTQHRFYVRARKPETVEQRDANAEEHEAVSQALARTREAIGWLEQLPEVQRIDAQQRGTR